MAAEEGQYDASKEKCEGPTQGRWQSDKTVDRFLGLTRGTSCPKCGYCPHCGRSNDTIPATPWYPWPIVTCNSNTTGGVTHFDTRPPSA